MAADGCVADSNADAYHLEELAIALRHEDTRRILPPIGEEHRRILDVGCGAGQTLIACECGANRVSCGVDVDFAALSLGKRLTNDVLFVCASGEALPFRSDYFDLVISRVAVPYMHVPKAIAEFARVSHEGATVWLVLHPVGTAVRELLTNLVRFHWRAVVGRLYVLANTVALHLWGTQFRFPFGRRHYESCQTRAGMAKAFLGAGYAPLELQSERFVVAMARKERR